MQGEWKLTKPAGSRLLSYLLHVGVLMTVLYIAFNAKIIARYSAINLSDDGEFLSIPQGHALPSEEDLLRKNKKRLDERPGVFLTYMTLLDLWRDGAYQIRFVHPESFEAPGTEPTWVLLDYTPYSVICYYLSGLLAVLIAAHVALHRAILIIAKKYVNIRAHTT